jgi:hypothetical protein
MLYNQQNYSVVRYQNNYIDVGYIFASEAFKMLHVCSLLTIKSWGWARTGQLLNTEPRKFIKNSTWDNALCLCWLQPLVPMHHKDGRVCNSMDWLYIKHATCK